MSFVISSQVALYSIPHPAFCHMQTSLLEYMPDIATHIAKYGFTICCDTLTQAHVFQKNHSYVCADRDWGICWKLPDPLNYLWEWEHNIISVYETRYVYWGMQIVWISAKQCIMQKVDNHAWCCTRYALEFNSWVIYATCASYFFSKPKVIERIVSYNFHYYLFPADTAHV